MGAHTSSGLGLRWEESGAEEEEDEDEEGSGSTRLPLWLPGETEEEAVSGLSAPGSQIGRAHV